MSINEQVKELREYSSNNCDYGTRLAKKAADTIEDLSAKLQAANMERSERYYNGGWIPCKDRLPEKYCHCLVTRRNDYEDGYDTDVIEDVFVELEGVWDWQSKHEGLIDNIIAWQPKPEPYKQK